jgi:Na+/proline symporter
VISAGLVQDVYLRLINPQANSHQLKAWTYVSMIVVGLLAICANINPPAYLQAIVVMSTSVGASALAIPMLMACYWRRATATGTLLAMLAGAGTVLLLFGLGQASQFGLLLPPQTIGMAKGFKPYFVLGLEPVVWGLLVSAICGIGVSLITKPPREEHLVKIFDAD